MSNNRSIFQAAFAIALWSATPLVGGTFGNVVSTVGGHPADLVLDESRNQLYIANFTALEVDVLSTQDRKIHSSISLAAHPSGIALSPDSNYLVVSEIQSDVPPTQGAVSVINLSTNAKQEFSTGDPALGVAFGINGQALIATSTGFYLLDPVSGYLKFLANFTNLSLALPVAQATFPGQIVQTQMTASADGRWIWGIADGGTGTQLIFRYDTRSGSFNAQVWVTTPALLPRVSVAADGSWALIGWSLYTPAQCGGGFMVRSRYPQAVASTSITGHAVNARNGATDTIFAQVFDPTQPSGPPYYPATSAGGAASKAPTLAVMDADNLTVRSKIYLPENLVGRAVLDSAGNNMYAISDSGISILPVGLLNRYPQLAASKEDLLLQTSFCTRTAMTTTFQITDPGNNGADFSISGAQPGIIVSPSSGRAPATITVTVQPGAIPATGGTLAVPLVINSSSAVNVPPTVRVLISNPDTDQRGTIINVPGQAVDLLTDVYRNRIYVLRQDKNQLLIFDGGTYQQIATLRTGTTPTSMALTNDAKSLIVACKDSNLIQVFDLDALQPLRSIQLPPSHYGMSVAQSNAGTFALIENDTKSDCAASASCAIDRLDFRSSCAFSPQTLGIFKNDNGVLPPTSVLAPSPDQNSILVASPTGNVMLYDAARDTFILSRNDLKSLSGAYAVSQSAMSSSSGPSFSTRYVVGDTVFDAALVPQGTLDTSVGQTVGFAFNGAGGYRVTGKISSGPGVIQNLPNVMQATNVRPVRTVESPVLSTTTQPFTRTVGGLSNSIVLLTTSGITVLAANYDAAVAPPAISSVVSAADSTQQAAPGGLISVYGQQLSPINIATQQIPLPTALGNSCLSVNGAPVPLLFVSSQQINAQLPFNVSGDSTLTIHTPGGVSNNFLFSVPSVAPGVFQTGSAGPVSGLATIVRADNNQLITPTNPIHGHDTVVIYLTGMGATSPAVEAGLPAPSSPLASATVTPSVTLGGSALEVLYAGLVPGEVGVYQINATVPGIVTAGMNIPLTISQGGSSTTINVRVVN